MTISGMQTFKRVAYALVIILFIFLVLVAIKYPEQKVKQAKLDYEVSSPEEQILKYAAEIEADRKLLEGYEFFRGSKGEKDAGPFLNNLVYFDNFGPSKIDLPNGLETHLKDKNWIALEPDFKELNLDFSWMEKLHEYDYWAPDANNPHFKAEDKPLLFAIPLPGYMELTNWAKLRLIHGRKTGTMQKALSDVRQLARLIYTNDYLVSSMVAIALLRHEAAFVQNYNPKIFGNWKTIPIDVLSHAKRYHWALPEMVDPRLSDETYERFSTTNVGQCQMISEGMAKNIILRDHLKTTYTKAINRFDVTVKKSLETCRKSIVHFMWNDTEWKITAKDTDYAKSLVKPENESDWKWKILMIHPRVEEYYAFNMLMISAPNYLKEYQKSEAKSE